MTVKRISALAFLLVLAVMPLWMFLSGWPHSFPQLSQEYVVSGEFTAQAEQSFKNNFPLREQLSNLAWNLRYRTGTRELDGYFITERGSVIKNVAGPNRDIVDANTDAVLGFAEQTGLPMAYFTLLPTACAIKQDDLPAFASVYNQKNFIESVYKSFGSYLTTVNTYSALLGRSADSIYFNTEELLTPLGGYVVYGALGAKLNLNVRPLDQFVVEYPVHDYYGSLSERYPYAVLMPDILPLYHFTETEGGVRKRSDYSVVHTSQSGSVTYPKLYRKECLTQGQPLAMYLGGSEPMIHIRAKYRPNTSLLVFGDATAKSYLPFLALHYSDLMFVDVTTVTEELLATLDAPAFDRVLFALSADTYMHSDSIQKIEFLW